MTTPEAVNAKRSDIDSSDHPLLSLPSRAERIRLRPSLSLWCFRALVHLAACVAIFLAFLPFWLQILLLCAVVLSACDHWRQWREQCQHLLYLQRKQQHWLLSLENAAGECVASRKVDYCYYRSSLLVILRLQPANEESSVSSKCSLFKRLLFGSHQPFGNYFAIMRDSCDAEGFKHVQVVARFFIQADRQDLDQL